MKVTDRRAAAASRDEPTAAEVAAWSDEQTLGWFDGAVDAMQRERDGVAADIELEDFRAARRQGEKPRNLAGPGRGFRDRREVYSAVIRSSRDGGKTAFDDRLRGSFRAGLGFALPPLFGDEVLQSVLTPESLAGRCRLLQSSQSTVSFPTDDRPAWDSAITPTWLGGPTSSTVTISQSKPDLSLRQFNLKRVAVLVPVTDELIDDSPALETYLDSVGPQRIRWELDYQLIHGSGVARPLGILNSPCTIDVADSPNTLSHSTLRQMLSRFHGDRTRALWLIHPDVEDDLLNVRDSGDNPVYTFGSESFGRVFGIPVLPHEACAASGTRGDLILADFGQYDLAAKSRRRALSTHLYFDQDLVAFRYILPIDAMPRLGAPITSRVGGGTRSPFVVLGAR